MNAGPSEQPSRVEDVALVLILLIVGGMAGAASFTHVKDWTMHNSPLGTHEWFGWANAVISELIPVAALLTIRRRRRARQPIGYPMFLLVAAVALSLSAQLAVAKPGLSGWLLSSVPALAFLGLSKLVLSTAPAPGRQPAPSAVPTDRANQKEQEEQPEPVASDPVPVVTTAPLPAAAALVAQPTAPTEDRPVYRTPPAPPRSALAPANGTRLS